MVKDRVWFAEARMGDGVAHLACLEKVLGRPLTLRDFKRNLPINEPIFFAFRMGVKGRFR